MIFNCLFRDKMFRLKGSKKEEQYRLLWAELVHLLEIGPQSSNHKKLLTFIKNENVTEASKEAKRLNTQTTNSPMSPPGSSELAANKKKTQHLLNSSGNRSVCEWNFDFPWCFFYKPNNHLSTFQLQISVRHSSGCRSCA